MVPFGKVLGRIATECPPVPGRAPTPRSPWPVFSMGRGGDDGVGETREDGTRAPPSPSGARGAPNQVTSPTSSTPPPTSPATHPGGSGHARRDRWETAADRVFRRTAGRGGEGAKRIRSARAIGTSRWHRRHRTVAPRWCSSAWKVSPHGHMKVNIRPPRARCLDAAPRPADPIRDERMFSCEPAHPQESPLWTLRAAWRSLSRPFVGRRI